MKYVSFVVDNLSLHYYQAEILLYSLEKNTSFTKDNIIVQCLNRVDQEFIDYLEENGYQYNLIEPYLDGKYCNKLQQLEYFKNFTHIEGVILMDTDMFVVDNLSQLQGDTVLAKVVDMPNPELETLQRIYEDAQLDIPKIISSDFQQNNNMTFANNFNGGLYYIPQKHILTISKEWKKWGAWLYERPNLFVDPKKFIHVDQISFGLALSANNIEYAHLGTEYNYPIHFEGNFNFFDENKDIKIVHYHQEINWLGYINDSKLKESKVINLIENINSLIAQKENFVFYKKYKQSIEPKVNYNNEVEKFEKNIIQLLEVHKKFKLIIHAGTPKTGTKSLQFFMHTRREFLESQGYLYPNIYLNMSDPKHQWIVNCMMEKNFDKFFDYIKQVVTQASEKIDTIFLSTEGIYNHWWDYSDEAKAILKVLAKYFNLQVWIFFREPLSFLNSLYRQYLKNPQMKNVACYGQDLSFTQILKDKWFIRHLDYLGFINDCEYIFGEKNIIVFRYSKNIIQDFCKYLNIETIAKDDERKNLGYSDLAIELLRVINRYNLKPNDKKMFLEKLSDCDTILKSYMEEKTLEKEKMQEKIDKLFSLQSKILKSQYDITW